MLANIILTIITKKEMMTTILNNNSNFGSLLKIIMPWHNFKLSFYQKRFTETLSLKLRPWFLTGFSDAEASFGILVKRKSSSTLGWVVEANFQITMHIKDVQLLREIQFTLKGVGHIYEYPERNKVYFIVTRLKDFVDVIIPHFDRYPLQSAKSIDYQLWKQCIMLIKNRSHLTLLGLEQIISIKSALNLGLSNQLQKAFPNVESLIRPSYTPTDDPLHPDWVSGFITGDGCLTVSIKSTNQVIVSLDININERDEPVLIKIKNFFNAGLIYSNPHNNACSFRITRIAHLISIVLPYLKSYPLAGDKFNNYNYWLEIVLLLEQKTHLTPDGLAKIRILVDKLNKDNKK